MAIDATPPDPETPVLQLAWPLRTVTAADGTVSFATVEQGTTAEVRAGLALACEVRRGRLPWAEEFGTPLAIARVDAEEAAVELAAALQEIDPREPVHVDVLDTTSGREIHLQVSTDPEEAVVVVH